MAGPAGVNLAGSVLDFDERTAQGLLDGGYAERVEGPPTEPPPLVETTEAAAAPEQAVSDRGRSGRKRGADGP
jgi:hypothetical protein